MEPNKSFKITFSDNWIKRKTILECSDGIQLLVTSDPKRKWYQLILQFITFGWYRATWYYTVIPRGEEGKRELIIEHGRDIS